MELEKIKRTDEFVRLCKVFKDHLEAEGVELSDYEIAHMAILCQNEITQAKEAENEIESWMDEMGYEGLKEELKSK